MGGNPEALPASELCPVSALHHPQAGGPRGASGPAGLGPSFPSSGEEKGGLRPGLASPREGQGLVAPITCTSVICEPSARRIFSVLVGYGLSRCLYNHCFRGRAMSCRACRLCRTFPPFCRALGQRERRGREPRPPPRHHASQPVWTPVPRARTWRCQGADGLGVTGQGHQLYTERGRGGGGGGRDPEARGWRVRWSDLRSRAVPSRGPGLERGPCTLSKNILSGTQARRWGFPSPVVKGRHWTVGIKRGGDSRPLPWFLCKLSLYPWILWVKGTLSKKGFVEERC